MSVMLEHRITQLEHREIALAKRAASLETHLRALIIRVEELERNECMLASRVNDLHRRMDKLENRCQYCIFVHEGDEGKICPHCGEIMPERGKDQTHGAE